MLSAWSWVAITVYYHQSLTKFIFKNIVEIILKWLAYCLQFAIS